MNFVPFLPLVTYQESIIISNQFSKKKKKEFNWGELDQWKFSWKSWLSRLIYCSLSTMCNSCFQYSALLGSFREFQCCDKMVVDELPCCQDNLVEESRQMGKRTWRTFDGVSGLSKRMFFCELALTAKMVVWEHRSSYKTNVQIGGSWERQCYPVLWNRVRTWEKNIFNSEQADWIKNKLIAFFSGRNKRFKKVKLPSSPRLSMPRKSIMIQSFPLPAM